jgi:hypothetical protein
MQVIHVGLERQWAGGMFASELTGASRQVKLTLSSKIWAGV